MSDTPDPPRGAAEDPPGDLAGDAATGAETSPDDPLGPPPDAADLQTAPPPVEPPVKRSRAGRPLGAAIAVGVALGGVVIASLAVDRRYFLPVVVLAIAVAHLELASAFRAAGIRVASVPVLAGGSAMIVLGFTHGPEAVLAGTVLTVLAVLLFGLALGRGPTGYVRDSTASTFAVFYGPFLACFATLMLAPHDGHLRIVAFVLTTVASDIGGYAVGVLYGRHPMAPTISPKKSWEGFGGSAASCVVAGVASVALFLDGRWWVGVVLGLALVVSATLGDLVESLIKRDLGIKDMGRLLPGHGGLLDRLDSLLLSAPIAWGILAWLVPA